MSGIRVNEWLHNSGTGGIWQTSAGNVGIASSVPTTKLEVTGDAKISGVTTAKSFVPTEGQFSNRNLLINGAMTVDQRGDNSSNTGNAFGGPDRWYWLGGADATCNTRQGGATDLAGFPRQYKVSVSSADSSISAGNYVVLRQIIEGRNVQAIEKGFSSAKELTLSFWLRMTNATGVYTCELRDSDNNRHCCKQFTVSDANWNKYTLTFPADTTGKLTDDNTASLEVQFWLTAGTDYTSGTLQTTWATFNSANANRAAGQTGNFVGSTSNVLELTGVQLEVGSAATPFEHRSYSDDLARCQRYYTLIGKGSGGTDGAGNGLMGYGFFESSSVIIGGCALPTTMRTQPSLDYTSGSGYYNFKAGGSNHAITSLVASSQNNYQFGFACTTGVSGTVGEAGRWSLDDASAYFAASAEL